MNPRRRLKSKLLDAQMIQIRDVVVQDEILLVLSHPGGLLFQDVLRPRPGRIAMREIIRPHQALDIAQVLHFECYVVVLEGSIYVLAEILTWHLGKRARG